MRWLRPRRRRTKSQVGPIDCASVAEVIHQYLDTELDAPTSQRVVEHLDLCRDCGLSAESYRSIKRALANSQHPDPDVIARLRRFADSLAEPVTDA